MTNTAATKMLEMLRHSDTSASEMNVKLDAETLSRVRRWELGSVKATVKMMIEIADQALTEAKKSNEQEATR